MKLRDGVRIEREGERAFLVDPAWARRVPLGRLSEALAQALVEEQDPAQLCPALAAELATSTAELESALRALLLLGTLAGAASEALAAAAARARGGLKPPSRVLPRARFGCQSSGQCCRIFRPGPLGPEDLAGLERARPALEASFPERFLHLDGEWVEDLAGTGEAPRLYLRREEGQCVFLLEDHRCAIHASAGFELKPEPCRAFPFDAVRTLHGGEDRLRVFEVGQCSAQLRATESGPSHAETAPATHALAPERPQLFHPLALLGGGLPADYAQLWPLEERLGALQEEGLPLAERVPRALALAAAYVSGLANCPLETDGPARAAAEVLTRDERGQTPALEAPDPAEEAAAWTAISASLSAALAGPVEREAPLADALSEALALAEAEALLRAGLLEEPPPLITRLAACALPEARAAALLSRVWRTRLFGARLLVAGQLEAGLLRLVLIERLTLIGARARAAARGEAEASEADLEATHWAAATVLDREGLRPALIEAGHLVWRLVGSRGE